MNIVKCCGIDQRSPFCNMCGRRLQAFPLSDLLVHCREQAEKHEKKVRAVVEKLDRGALPVTAELQAVLAHAGLNLPQRSSSQVTRALSANQRAELDKSYTPAVEWRSYASALENLMRLAASLPPDQAGLLNPPDASARTDGEVRNLEL